AYVVINGLLASGKTPGSFPLYEGLSNEIVFYSSDHQPLRLRMTAKADQETTRVELERARSQSRARIYLRSQPTGAVVFLNGMRLGTTPLRMENVEADHEHHIQMSLDDHFGFAGFVQLSQAMDNRVEAILDPVTSVSRQSFVELRFEVQPRGTRVDIEGDARGVSPFIDNHRRDHLLEVKFEGHQREPLTRLVATSEVGSFLFAPTLESIPQATGKVGLTVTPEAAIFIGSRAYGAGPVKNLDLPEGRHTVVFETVSGQRLRAQIEVKPNKANQFDVRLRDGKALVHVID
ncbi:MAG: PEGA domain-containing protein, partial [Bradymonadaceae bacterium]